MTPRLFRKFELAPSDSSRMPSRRVVIAGGLASFALSSCRTGDFNTFDKTGSDAIVIAGFRPQDATSSPYSMSLNMVYVDPETFEKPPAATRGWAKKEILMGGGAARPYVWDQASRGSYIIEQVAILDVKPTLGKFRNYIFEFPSPKSQPDQANHNFQVELQGGKVNYIGDFIFRVSPATKEIPLKFYISRIDSSFEQAKQSFPEMHNAGLPFVENLLRPLA